MRRLKEKYLGKEANRRKNIQQIIILVGLIGLFAFFAYNASIKLKQQGLTAGYGFLTSPAKFDIQFTLLEYSGKDSYARAFLVGILNTLLVAGLGILFTTIIGFFVGLARVSSHFFIAKIANIYIELFRNIPLLLQIIFWYFLILQYLPNVENSWNLFNFAAITIKGVYIPDFLITRSEFLIFTILLTIIVTTLWLSWSKKRHRETGKSYPRFIIGLLLLFLIPFLFIWLGGVRVDLEYPLMTKVGNIHIFKGGIQIIPELFALVIALTLYTSTFFAECVRAGLLSVRRGQSDAAVSLGLSKRQTLQLIVIPLALRVIIPPATNQYLNLTKNSSLAAAIAYPDVFTVLAGTTLNQTGRAIEIIFLTMLTYLTISLLISLLMNWYNKRWAIQT